MRPRETDLTRTLSSTSGALGWRIPVISQRAYLSGGDGGTSPFLTGSLPLDMAHPFDAAPLLRQSAEFMAINSLLSEGLDTRAAASPAGSTQGGWTDQPIRTEVGGGDGNTRITPRSAETGLSFFSVAIESLGTTDSQRELVKKAVLDLKKYIAVAQPNSQDMILQDQTDQPPLTVSFNSGDSTSEADQAIAPAAGDDNLAPASVDTAQDPVSEYTRMFSISSIWEFLTSSTMIALYVLMLALWAAWRYAIRRYV